MRCTCFGSNAIEDCGITLSSYAKAAKDVDYGTTPFKHAVICPRLRLAFKAVKSGDIDSECNFVSHTTVRRDAIHY